MWRLTWQQMRRTVSRLVAVGIAVALGTAFIAASFIATGTIEQTTLDAARADVGDPDLVVLGGDHSLTDSDLESLAELNDIAALQPLGDTYEQVGSGGRSQYLMFAAPPAHERLGTVTVTEGELPTSPGEVALPASTAENLGVGIGSTLEVTQFRYGDDGVETLRPTPVRVVGLTADGSGLGFGAPTALVSAATLADWRAAEGTDHWRGATLLLSDPGAASAVSAQVASLLPGTTVLTGEEYGRQVASSLTSDVSVFQGLLLAFGAVAMAVAGIVIANTFTVLVAQRTRTLALLRCVGATRRQVRSTVRREALVVGVVASVVGIAIGVGLGQIVLMILGSANEGVPLPGVVPVDLWTIVVPLAVGVGVTVLAAGGAARAATRVAPLAALRPVAADAPDAPDGEGRRPAGARAVTGWVAIAGGAAGMALAVVWSQSDPASTYMPALALGVVAGIVSLVGLVLAGGSIVPPLSRLLGRAMAAVGGVPGRLAATGTERNPARTTSTATALVVGVTLVTLMATGAGTARTQLDNALADQYSMDLAVSAQEGESLSPALVSGVEKVDGVAATVLAQVTHTEVTSETGTRYASVLAVADPSAVAGVLRTSADTAALARGSVLADGWLVNQDGPVSVGGLELPAVYVHGLPDSSLIVTQDVMQRLESAGVVPDSQTILVRMTDGADPRTVVTSVQRVVTENTPAGAPVPAVDGGAVERAGFGQIVDTLLVVVIGLLAVAIVIALIGVANTLTLSVVERRQENALLRALGLRRRQLRASLALEGVMLALVGCVVGIVAGLVYGWVGSQLLLGVAVDGIIGVTVPWLAIAAVVVVAVVAGVLASVLPARRAVKVPPVVALGA